MLMILASRRKSRILYDKVTVLLMFSMVAQRCGTHWCRTALVRTRRLVKRLERLTESYWELRYENGQLRARVNRLDPSRRRRRRCRTRAGRKAFVPLSH